MQLYELLKQLKSIKPDATYTKASRQAILESTPIMPTRTIWGFLSHSFQFGSALALAGVLLVLVLGGVSTWKFLSPFKLASLDTSALRAEAQAIDTQIELAKIQYSEPQKVTSIPATPSAQPTKSVAKGVAENEAQNLGLASPTTSTQTLSIDDALNNLME